MFHSVSIYAVGIRQLLLLFIDYVHADRYNSKACRELDGLARNYVVIYSRPQRTRE